MGGSLVGLDEFDGWMDGWIHLDEMDGWMDGWYGIIMDYWIYYRMDIWFIMTN